MRFPASLLLKELFYITKSWLLGRVIYSILSQNAQKNVFKSAF
jgi:hypothetical protein